ncbi:MAG: radical SAM protein [Candidatus Omnitrophota bacterium]|nr:B12-binding domain-containing radical SAM protein [Candidatus Omnitrophota bacterium]
MARVLLIDPPWYALQNVSYNKVSYGLASCAAVLRNNRHECILYNGEFGLVAEDHFKQDVITNFGLYLSNLEENSPIWKKTWHTIRTIIGDFKPDIVGITMPTAKYAIVVKITNHIKNEFSQVIIVAGGPHPTILPLETLKESSIDVVVKHEGELTFLELVNAIEKKSALENVAGIAFKCNGAIRENQNRPYIQDLDSLPFPAWDCTYQGTQHPPDSFGILFTSRGCPYQCTYCASNKIWSRKTRFMSADRVLAELIYTAQRFKASTYRIADDTFILDKNRVMEICEKIKNAQLTIQWMCDIRADLCTPEILQTMKSAGCFRVNIGVESGNPEILNYIKKNITPKQVRRAFAMVKKAKLESLAYFMIGFPNETLKQVHDTTKLMYKLKSDFSCFCIVTPYPGTELYDYASCNGILPSTGEWSNFFHHSPKMGLTKNIAYDTLIQIIKKIQVKLDSDKEKNYRRKVFKRRIGLLVSNPMEFVARLWHKAWAFLKPR